MRTLRVVSTLLALFAVATTVRSQEGSSPSTDEHKWLEQLVGEWTTSSELVFGPGMPPVKAEGKEAVRKIGGLWTVSEHNGSVMGTEFTGVMTLGYDPEKKKYIGTWVDSVHNHLWHYVGTLDEAKKVLTLEAEGPNPAAPGKKGKFRDVITINDKDTKVMTSSMQMEDGSWTQFMTVTYKRKK